MARPVTKEFNCTRQELMQSLPKAAKSMNLVPIGEKPILGLASFRLKTGEMLYAHCTSKSEAKTVIAIAPGLPNLEEHKQSELPISVINAFLDQLNQYIQE